MNSARLCKQEMLIEGKYETVRCVCFGDTNLVIEGKFLKKVRLRDEWIEDLKNPPTIIGELRGLTGGPDLLTFWQRIPETEPKYGYHMEWEGLAAIPVRSYEDWWNNRISSDTRNKIRKAPKKGIEIKVIEFNDELIEGIMNIYNENPIKRGKKFRHYGKDFSTVKRDLSDALERSDFIGAYLEGQLIGFVKLNYADRYAMMTMILSMMRYLGKFPNNALIAKAVATCAEKRIPYLTYTKWRSGSHGHFQHLMGFEKVNVPRYYIPLTARGRIGLRLNLHRGIAGILPGRVLSLLLKMRKRVYAIKYGET